MKQHLRLLRPHQWIKNVFVLIPAFFAGKIALLASDYKLAVAFISFCAIASSVYIFNDIYDLEKDKLHELKRSRPLATGAVSIKTAIVLMLILAAVAVGSSLLVSLTFFYVIAGYFALNLVYSLVLKHVSLIDISLIAVGFVLRVLAGGIAAQVPVSKWLILMTFLLASCLALGKRRDDLLLDVDKHDLRPSLKGYTLPFIDTCLIVLGGTTIVCYIMYTVSEDVVKRLHSDHIYLTAVFVIIGILRFLQIAIVEQKSGSPTLILLKDTMIQTMIGLWFVAFLVILYAS
ncbi:MAG TPA: UbiA prenyltransferase family protein [Pyrinomonadaceae bacterium]|nr:UbiA prenyltransferase family protein [Acidobacteriota bacterium]HQZ97271.1 UbiA prenyltransferase family protein [Pyrinomonadaceae bacterium]